MKINEFIKIFFRFLGYSINSADNEVVDLLLDVDIALGNDYEQPGRDLFPLFSPHLNFNQDFHLSLSKRLAKAYQLLETTDEKRHVLNIVHRALERCTKEPLGIRRTLTCLDLAHEIDPAIITDEMFSDLMFRPQNKEELEVFIFQLVYRWEKWQRKVVLSNKLWKKAVKEIDPMGLFSLVLYFKNNFINSNTGNNIYILKELCDLASKRVDKEEYKFLNIGHPPEKLRYEIKKLRNIYEWRTNTLEETTGLNNEDLDGIHMLFNNLDYRIFSG